MSVLLWTLAWTLATVALLLIHHRMKTGLWTPNDKRNTIGWALRRRHTDECSEPPSET